MDEIFQNLLRLLIVADLISEVGTEKNIFKKSFSNSLNSIHYHGNMKMPILKFHGANYDLPINEMSPTSRRKSCRFFTYRSVFVCGKKQQSQTRTFHLPEYVERSNNLKQEHFIFLRKFDRRNTFF